MTHEPTGPRPPLQLLTLAVQGDVLYGVSQDQGELYPLYVFAPLQEALLAGDRPPLAPEWHRYVRGLVLRYLPVPAIDPRRVPRDLATDVGQQTRDLDPVRRWTQLTYRYWPLYCAEPGLIEAPEPARPLLFQPATRGLQWLYGPDDGGPGDGKPGGPPVTFPPPYLGP